MSIVVLTRTSKSIDLTASLLLGFKELKSGHPDKIEWIVEEDAENFVFDELSRLAGFFCDKLDIVVERQKNIPELYPSTLEIINVLRNIFEKSNADDRTIRIQHGAIICCEDSGKKKRYRYFFFDDDNDLILLDSKKHPETYKVQEKQCRLLIQGSVNLIFLRKYGRLAHLPWYCLDSKIDPLEVEGIISPPEGCSKILFQKNSSGRLFPLGYSTYEYSIKKYWIFSFSEWIFKAGSSVRSRRKSGSNSRNSVIQFISHEARKDIITNGFQKSINKILVTSDTPGDILYSLLMVWNLSKIMITYECGFLENIKQFGVIQQHGNLYDDEAEILYSLISGVDYLYSIAYKKKFNKKDEILKDKHPFGRISQITYEIAKDFFDRTFLDVFYKHKATVENLLKEEKNGNNIFDMFESFLNERNNQTLLIKGSIFDYDEF